MNQIRLQNVDGTTAGYVGLTSQPRAIVLNGHVYLYRRRGLVKWIWWLLMGWLFGDTIPVYREVVAIALDEIPADEVSEYVEALMEKSEVAYPTRDGTATGEPWFPRPATEQNPADDLIPGGYSGHPFPIGCPLPLRTRLCQECFGTGNFGIGIICVRCAGTGRERCE